MLVHMGTTLLCLFCLLGLLSAQTGNGTITGLVTDSTGAVVANAAIEAKNQTPGAGTTSVPVVGRLHASAPARQQDCLGNLQRLGNRLVPPISERPAPRSSGIGRH